MRTEEAVTWAAIYCAAFATAFFVGSVVLRVMWRRGNS